MVREVEPMVMKKFELEYRDKSKLLTFFLHFRTVKIPTKRAKSMKIFKGFRGSKAVD